MKKYVVMESKKLVENLKKTVCDHCKGKTTTPTFMDGFLVFHCLNCQKLSTRLSPVEIKNCPKCFNEEHPHFNTGIVHYYCIDCDLKFY